MGKLATINRVGIMPLSYFVRAYSKIGLNELEILIKISQAIYKINAIMILPSTGDNVAFGGGGDR